MGVVGATGAAACRRRRAMKKKMKMMIKKMMIMMNTTTTTTREKLQYCTRSLSVQQRISCDDHYAFFSISFHGGERLAVCVCVCVLLQQQPV